jgi:uncharacterized DUF497 family protein
MILVLVTVLACAFICTYNESMKILWDAAKAKSNLDKHGVRFENTRRVLSDPFALTREDSDAAGEQRFVTLGMGGAGQILVVVYTYRDPLIRLISAWKANAAQRRRYESQF